MAIIRDMMQAFELFQPASIDEAMDLLSRYEDSWVLSGGLDSLERFKERHLRPRTVIDVSGVDELSGIRDRDGGLEVGAMTTLTEIVTNETIRQRFGVLSAAAYAVATPQIRNQGTIGGNIAQDTRCWYYRDGWTCYRAGGNICYASPPTAMNREHCILGASLCVAVNPSDTAPVLVALEAEMVVRRGTSERVVAAEEFFVGPEIDIERMTVLLPRWETEAGSLTVVPAEKLTTGSPTVSSGSESSTTTASWSEFSSRVRCLSTVNTSAGRTMT